MVSYYYELALRSSNWFLFVADSVIPFAKIPATTNYSLLSFIILSRLSSRLSPQLNHIYIGSIFDDLGGVLPVPQELLSAQPASWLPHDSLPLAHGAQFHPRFSQDHITCHFWTSTPPAYGVFQLPLPQSIAESVSRMLRNQKVFSWLG